MTKKRKRKAPTRRHGLPKGAHRVRIEVATMLRRWYVRVDGLIEDGDGFRTQSAAIRAAVRVAKGEKFASVRIHDWHGRFIDERTFPRSSDPMPPRG
jgi:hypothetical protein